MHPKAHMQFKKELSFIFWGVARHGLQQMQNNGEDISLNEGKGLLSREFTFQGDRGSLVRMKHWLEGVEQAFFDPLKSLFKK